MLDRRQSLQLMAAVASTLGVAALSPRALAQQRPTEEQLIGPGGFGNVTLLHVTDLHAQTQPLHFREPAVNLGVGEERGRAPFITGRALLDAYNLRPGTLEAYLFTDQDFANLAHAFGRVGGLDRIARVVNRIRAERGAERTLLLDGGDTWTNSLVSTASKGQDMVEAMALLKPDAMTAHWEFTLGEERVKEIVASLDTQFLCQNVRDTEFEDEVFKGRAMFERGGATIAVIGQASPYTPIANPRWMIPNWTFGIRERELQRQVEEARAEGADIVVLLSHNGFAVDRKLAGRVRGIDIILAGHTHDALPEPVQVGRTLIVASGSHGKFVSRLDLDIRDKELKGFRHRLVPVLSDVVAADPAMAALVARHRAPHEAELRRVVGRTEGVLYRRGNFNGTLDDLLCDAMLAERDAEIALSPGVRWGPSVLPGDITAEDIHNATSMTYPATYRMTMTGQRLKEVLEDVADNIFNPDPYLQQGGDMVRLGGMRYAIDITRPIGQRISDMRTIRGDQPIEAGRSYTIAGWASVNQDTEGPPIWDVVFAHLAKTPVVTPRERDTVRVTGA